MTRRSDRGGRILELVEGDITTLPSDAIVNAANAQLAGGGGVDGAIHRAGGPAIMAELRRRYPEGCPTGGAVATGAGDLPARWVIHAVGPVWHGGQHGEAEALAAAYGRSLELAAELGARSVTLPAISCGVYGYPLAEAEVIAVSTVVDALAPAGGAASIEHVRFVLRGRDVMRAFEGALDRLAAGAAAR